MYDPSGETPHELMNPAHHLQTNGKAERYNKTIVTRLCHYVAESQRNWELFVQLLSYAYDTQADHTIGMTPFSPGL